MTKQVRQADIPVLDQPVAVAALNDDIPVLEETFAEFEKTIPVLEETVPGPGTDSRRSGTDFKHAPACCKRGSVPLRPRRMTN